MKILVSCNSAKKQIVILLAKVHKLPELDTSLSRKVKLSNTFGGVNLRLHFIKSC